MAICANEQLQLSEENIIYCNVFSCEKVYDAKNSILNLKSNNLFEINLITSGEGVLCVLGQDIPCKKGDMCIIPPNVLHEYFLYSERDSLIVRKIQFNLSEWFSGDVVDTENKNYCYGVFNDNRMLAYSTLNAHMQDRVHFFYDYIKNEVLEQKYGWQELVKGYLANLLISLARYSNFAIKNINFVSPETCNMVLNIIAIVKEEYKEHKLSLNSIARRLYVSQSQLSRNFKKVLGVSFSEYLKDVRIKEACKLLKNRSLNIENVARESGFLDIPTFYKVFSAKVGMTPNSYRNSTLKVDVKLEYYKNLLKGEKIMNILNDISENLQKGKSKIVKELVQQALDEGVKPEDILSEGLLVGMGVISEKFKNNEVYVPEVLVAAKAMNMGAQVLKPYLFESGVQAKGKVCIGTVHGDLHDIGKNLVKMMMEGKGLEVIDLGTDVAPETFVQTAIEQNCQVICCSALLTTTMGVMEEVVKVAESAGIRNRVKIMIGGAPVSQEYCDKINADCYTLDAASAADAAVDFCKA